MTDVCNCGEPELACTCPRCPRCACALLLSEAGPICDPCLDLEAPICNAQPMDLAHYRARDRAVYGDRETLRNSSPIAPPGPWFERSRKAQPLGPLGASGASGIVLAQSTFTPIANDLDVHWTEGS